MGAIANLFGYLLNFLYNLFNNYGIAIIVFSVILRIILIPVTISQQKSMKKSAKMQEKMKEIQNKYKNNPEKLNQETIDLYKREKMNPFSGCLSSILQIIIILSVFWLVSKPLTYMKKVDTEVINGYIEEIKAEDGKAATYPEIQVIQRKAAEDERVYINMDFFGLDLSKVPNQNMSDWTVYIIPVLYVITSFVSIKITNSKQNKVNQESKEISEDVENKEVKDPSDEALESMQQMTNSMSYMIPIMSISIAFIAPLGLALYWLMSNVLMIIERLIIEKVFKDKEEEEENA
ncbi:MAG: YidC/Oxa1 family membrane protein insertase [Clostridia bacterium]